MINRKRELDEEQESLQKAFDTYQTDYKQMKKIIKEKRKKPEVQPVTPLAQVTAKAFCVLGLQSGVEIVGKKSSQTRECASLTKIMTLWTTLRLCEKH